MNTPYSIWLSGIQRLPRPTSCWHDVIAEQLINRLPYIKIQPKHILLIGHLPMKAWDSLINLYPEAHFTVVCPMQSIMTSLNSPPRYPWLPKAFPLFNKKTIHRIQGHPNQLPVRHHQFDLVLSHLWIGACDDLSETLKETERVLAPNGLLLFNCLGLDTAKELHQAIVATQLQASIPTFPDMHDVGDILQQLRFNNVVMSTDQRHVRYQTLLGCLKDFKASGTLCSQTNQKGLLSTQHLQQIEAHMPRQDTGLTISAEIIVGQAWQRPAVSSPINADGQTTLNLTPSS